MHYKTVVILAKSQQRDGYCIAGRELFLDRKKNCLGKWLRLVSADKFSHGAILPSHLSDDQDVSVLDVVLVPIKSKQPKPGQPDNVLIDESDRWVAKGKMPAVVMSGFVESPSNLWWQTDVPSHIVPADKDDKKHVPQSLYIIQGHQLSFTLSHRFNRFTGKFERKIKASFYYQSELYENFSVRDTKVRRMLSGQYPDVGMPDKVVTLLKGDHYFLCVSLGASFGSQKNHYKSVLTVFDFDGYLQSNYA